MSDHAAGDSAQHLLWQEGLDAPSRWYWTVDRSGTWRLGSGKPPADAVDLERPETWPLPVRLRRRWTSVVGLFFGAVFLLLLGLVFLLVFLDHPFAWVPLATSLALFSGGMVLLCRITPGLPLYRGRRLILDRSGLKVEGLRDGGPYPWSTLIPDGEWPEIVTPGPRLLAATGPVARKQDRIILKPFIKDLNPRAVDTDWGNAAVADLMLRLRVLAGERAQDPTTMLKLWKKGVDGTLTFDPDNPTVGRRLAPSDLLPGHPPFRIESPPFASDYIGKKALGTMSVIVVVALAWVLPRVLDGGLAVITSETGLLLLAGAIAVSAIGVMVTAFRFWRRNRGTRRIVMAGGELALDDGSGATTQVALEDFDAPRMASVLARALPRRRVEQCATLDVISELRNAHRRHAEGKAGATA